jgi:hypothetical protein
LAAVPPVAASTGSLKTAFTVPRPEAEALTNVGGVVSVEISGLVKSRVIGVPTALFAVSFTFEMRTV